MKKKSQMVEALQKELLMRKDEFQNSEIQTIYLGGGTPSTLSIKELSSLFELIYKYFKVSKASENTIEVNPDDFFSDGIFQRNHLLELKSLGINRLSVGVQSFFEEDLHLMNRPHSAREIRHFLHEASVFFDNISIDLIYGIPRLSDEKWISNIQTALDLKIPHISAYALTVEPRTVLQKWIDSGKIPPVDEEQSRRQFYILMDVLKQNNYVHYELSNWGKKGYFSRNNSAYWQGKKYIGIGPSAHSFNGKERSWNVSNNSLYINSIFQKKRLFTKEILSLQDQFNELILTALRTQNGIYLPWVRDRFGEEKHTYLLKNAQPFLLKKWLKIESNHLVTAYEGWFYLDGICSDLFWVD